MANIKKFIYAAKKAKPLQLYIIHHFKHFINISSVVWPKVYAVLNPCVRDHSFSMEYKV